MKPARSPSTRQIRVSSNIYTRVHRFSRFSSHTVAMTNSYSTSRKSHGPRRVEPDFVFGARRRARRGTFGRRTRGWGKRRVGIVQFRDEGYDQEDP